MEDNIYIYGHNCNHDLIKPRQEYNYGWIKNDAVRSVKAKWAITPFNNNDVLEYKVVCREFGRPLEMVYHHWSSIMDVERLWYIVSEMDWDQIEPTARSNRQLKYQGWYDQYFKDIYTPEQYRSILRLA
tara:strand:+ start:435 stop:821 length:387 start_codon:yes stop_codon:yes gene_type:complete